MASDKVEAPKVAESLIGFALPKSNRPGFATPIFGSPESALVQVISGRRTVEGFVNIGPVEGDRFVPVDRSLRRVTLESGSSALFAFALSPGEIAVGSSEALSERLNEWLPRLSNAPFALINVASFIGDTPSVRKALAAVRPKSSSNGSDESAAALYQATYNRLVRSVRPERDWMRIRRFSKTAMRFYRVYRRYLSVHDPLVREKLEEACQSVGTEFIRLLSEPAMVNIVRRAATRPSLVQVSTPRTEKLERPSLITKFGISAHVAAILEEKVADYPRNLSPAIIAPIWFLLPDIVANAVRSRKLSVSSSDGIKRRLRMGLLFLIYGICMLLESRFYEDGHAAVADSMREYGLRAIELGVEHFGPVGDARDVPPVLALNALSLEGGCM